MAGAGVRGVGAEPGLPDRYAARKAETENDENRCGINDEASAAGAGAADAVAGRRGDGRGIVVNSSRGILGAWRLAVGADWKTATRDALAVMNNDLCAAV